MQIMDALDRLGIPQGSSVDAVAHSRGGLVYRMLAEKVLANRRPDIKLGKAIFVGCTNGGTHLAEPENWAAMVDLYTNAIMAGARAIVGLAGGAMVSPARVGGASRPSGASCRCFPKSRSAKTACRGSPPCSRRAPP